MSHKLVEELPELQALAERETKLRDKAAKYGRAVTKWQQEFDQAQAAYEDALMESIESGGPPPDKPEPPPAPEINTKQRAVTEQLIFIRDERKEILRQHGGELLDRLAQRESEILRGLVDAVRLLERGSRELTELRTSVDELETVIHPGQRRDEVPADLLTVTQVVADGRDSLPVKAPPPAHATMRTAGPR